MAGVEWWRGAPSYLRLAVDVGIPHIRFSRSSGVSSIESRVEMRRVVVPSVFSRTIGRESSRLHSSVDRMCILKVKSGRFLTMWTGLRRVGG